MTKVGKWEFSIEQDEDNNWIWFLYYDWHPYDPDDVICSESFKTSKACKKNAIKHMEKMHEKFGKLIDKAVLEKS